MTVGTPQYGNSATISVNAVVLDLVEQIDGIDMEKGTLSVTCLGDTAERLISTILKGSKLSFSVRYDGGDTGHAGLWTIFHAGTVESYILTIPSTTATHTFTFSGYMTKLGLSGYGPEDSQVAKFEVSVTGDISYA